jgi:hypothetical protein
MSMNFPANYEQVRVRTLSRQHLRKNRSIKRITALACGFEIQHDGSRLAGSEVYQGIWTPSKRRALSRPEGDRGVFSRCLFAGWIVLRLTVDVSKLHPR